jgi:hypothetical protein
MHNTANAIANWRGEIEQLRFKTQSRLAMAPIHQDREDNADVTYP